MRISDTSAQDVQIAPSRPRKRLLIAGASAVLVVSSLLLAAPWVERWANAAVSVPYDRIRTATVTRGDLVRDVSVQGRVVAAVSPTLLLLHEQGQTVDLLVQHSQLGLGCWGS